MRFYVAICALLVLSALPHARYAAGEMYEWVDQEGRKHCTNIDPNANAPEPNKPGEKNLVAIKTRENFQAQTAHNPEPVDNKPNEGSNPAGTETFQAPAPKNDLLNNPQSTTSSNESAKDSLIKDIQLELLKMREMNADPQSSSNTATSFTIESELVKQFCKGGIDSIDLKCNQLR